MNKESLEKALAELLRAGWEELEYAVLTNPTETCLSCEGSGEVGADRVYKSRSELPIAKLVDYLPEFIEAFKVQLESDHKRWGCTWMNRPRKGQELRTKVRFTDYFDMFEHTGTPVPWLKVIGGAFICWVRENHPELCIDGNKVDENES